MGSVITFGPVGFIAGPFAIHPDRPFGAWFELLSLGGATSVAMTTETSDDEQTWSVANTSPSVTVPGGRETSYVEDPPRYARLVFSASAAPTWTGPAVISYDASREEWDLALEAMAAREEQARRAAFVAAMRQQLGIDRWQPSGRVPDGLFLAR